MIHPVPLLALAALVTVSALGGTSTRDSVPKGARARKATRGGTKGAFGGQSARTKN